MIFEVAMIGFYFFLVFCRFFSSWITDMMPMMTPSSPTSRQFSWKFSLQNEMIAFITAVQG